MSTEYNRSLCFIEVMGELAVSSEVKSEEQLDRKNKSRTWQLSKKPNYTGIRETC